MLFGALSIEKKLAEFPSVRNKARIITAEKHADYINLSKHFKVKFFGLTHSIPDASGVIVQTPLGGIVSTGDVRVENTDGVPTPEEVEGYAFLKDEDILLLAMDSTNIERPGWSASEAKVRSTIDTIIKEAPAQAFCGVFFFSGRTLD